MTNIRVATVIIVSMETIITTIINIIFSTSVVVPFCILLLSVSVEVPVKYVGRVLETAVLGKIKVVQL